MKNKRGRSYKLTPRRKAALHKAQLASARKRSRRVGKVIGVVGVTIAAGGAAYAGHRYMKGRKPSVKTSAKTSTKTSKSVSTPVTPNVVSVTLSTSKELDLVRITANPKLKNWGNVGRPARTTVTKQTKIPEHDRLWNKKRKSR